jgi:hypothetical protein
MDHIKIQKYSYQLKYRLLAEDFHRPLGNVK